MISVTIDSVTIPADMGTELVRDGTEAFDFGQLIIQHSTQREAYPDYADVELTINSVDYEAIIQKDTPTRVAEGFYKHTIVLGEVVLKLAEYYPPDRKFDTIGGSKTTYKYQLETTLNTLFYGKTVDITVHADTLDLLDVDSDEKEYTGHLLNHLIDMFRAVNAFPTLSLDNEIGHQLLNELGNEVSYTNIIGEIIESDIVDYGLAVHAKVKNGTYEADLITGGTYFPAKGQGVTPRSKQAKYSDKDVEWHIDGGIRRFVEARIKNLDSQTLGVQTTADISQWIVSKDEWDSLEIERTHTTLYTGKYQNNTLYYVEGDFRIQNAGVRYHNDNGSYTPPALGQQVIDAVIEAYWYDRLTGVSEFNNQSIRTMEISFYYQPIRDSEIRQERHDIERVTKNATKLNNQKDSTLELNRFGNSNKALINRIGNDKYQITIRYYERDTPTFFDLNDYLTTGYRISKIKYLTRHTSCDVTYSFTKNQATLNPVTSVNSKVSPFTVSKKHILTNFIYNEYVEFAGSKITDTSSVSNLPFRYRLLNALAYASGQDEPIYNAQFYSSDADITSQYINMSVQKLPIGQSFNFNAQFLHPTIAGWQLVDDTGYLGKKLKPVRYTNAYGEVNNCRTFWGNTPTTVADNHPVGAYDSSWIMQTPLETIDLNPNEKFGMTIAQHCYTDRSRLIIGDYFLKNNSLIRELGGAPGISVIEYPTNPHYTIYDQVAKPYSTGFGSLAVDLTNYEYFEVTVQNGYSWAIVKSTAPFNVYFAYNNEGIDMDRVYINLLKYRTDVETL